MAEMTVNPASDAMTRLYQKVLERASKNSENKDIPREKLLASVSQVISEDLHFNPEAVSNIESLQFKAHEQVPVDFFFHFRVADQRMLDLVSSALIGRLVEEGHLSNDAAIALVENAASPLPG